MLAFAIFIATITTEKVGFSVRQRIAKMQGSSMPSVQDEKRFEITYSPSATDVLNSVESIWRLMGSTDYCRWDVFNFNEEICMQ